MNIPTQKTITLSQASRFCEGLRLLGQECGLTDIRYNKLGILSYMFNDGSSVGSMRAAIEAGWLQVEDLN